MSRGTSDVDFSDLPSGGVAVADAGAGGTAAEGDCTGGAACTGATGAGGCDSAGACGDEGAACCCADDGNGSDSDASADITTHAARKGDMLILRPSSG